MQNFNLKVFKIFKCIKTQAFIVKVSSFMLIGLEIAEKQTVGFWREFSLNRWEVAMVQFLYLYIR